MRIQVSWTLATFISLVFLFIYTVLYYGLYYSQLSAQSPSGSLYWVAVNNFDTVKRLWRLPVQNTSILSTGPIEIDVSSPNQMLEPVTLPNERSNGSIRERLAVFNQLQYVQNEDLYGKLPSPSDSDLNDTYSLNCVIVVQVHNRSSYLALLIDSLRRVKEIEQCLLVFSHDVYSGELNALISDIRFARVVQIFFPHSLQAFPNSFPDADPMDCPRDLPVDEAKKTGCLNADWPDSYHHFREAPFVQAKHHWLWKTEFVFKHLVAVSKFHGPVLFLEEDHFLLEDALHVLQLLSQQPVSIANEKTHIIVLGTYAKNPSYEETEAVRHLWSSSKHNMGMAFSRALWSHISSCLKTFCAYDDYNWDWSLQYMGSNCVKGGLWAIVLPTASRVYHLGSCSGLHHSQKALCDPVLMAATLIRKFTGSLMSRLYPSVLKVSSGLTSSRLRPRKNGGWGDMRDQALCQSILSERWFNTNDWTQLQRMSFSNISAYSTIF